MYSQAPTSMWIHTSVIVLKCVCPLRFSLFSISLIQSWLIFCSFSAGNYAPLILTHETVCKFHKKIPSAALQTRACLWSHLCLSHSCQLADSQGTWASCEPKTPSPCGVWCIGKGYMGGKFCSKGNTYVWLPNSSVVSLSQQWDDQTHPWGKG